MNTELQSIKAEDYNFNSQFFGWHPHKPVWTAFQMKSLREDGKKLMIIKLIEDDVLLLCWYKPNSSHIKKQLAVRYHSNSMIKKWIKRSEIDMVEAVYENFIR